MGMAERQDILGDDGPSAPKHWDPIWRDLEKPVHIWLSINGVSDEEIEQRYQEIRRFVAQSNGGVEQLEGHRGPNGAVDLPYQAVARCLHRAHPTDTNHRSHMDGWGRPGNNCGRRLRWEPT